MKKETLELINKKVADYNALEDKSVWYDVYDILTDLGWTIHENSKSFREYVEEETPAAYELCKRIGSSALWEAYERFNDADPEAFTDEEYREFVEICKEHAGEPAFDDMLYVLDGIAKYFEEEDE